MEEFNINPKGFVAVDIGASTGGFTDCLLKRGVKKVYSVDVGYGQLEGSLRNDKRVIVIDRQNARHISPDQIGESVDLVVVDVSFISLKLILPPIMDLLKPCGQIIALVKPQFEVGKDEVENKGVIKDSKKHYKVLLIIRDFICSKGWTLKNLTSSPIRGQKGNKEFLIQCLPVSNNSTSLNDYGIRKKMDEKI